MYRIIEKINNVLRYQKSFRWQNINDYKGFKNSFEYHVQHHPIRERKYGKWNPLIDYSTNKSISDSYYNTSINLSKKFETISKGKYDIQYVRKHESVNIVDLSNGLVSCLKYNKYTNYFDIATCFFPSKLNKLFSIKNMVISEKDNLKNKEPLDKIYFVLYEDVNNSNTMDSNLFEEAMSDFFGKNSIEYQILFNNISDNTEKVTEDIKKEVNDYVDMIKNLIKDEYDKEYYFVFNDGIEYVAKLAILYKAKDNNYKEVSEKFLSLDINNTYKESLNLCLKYIDESEEKNGRNN